ncbi:hypothetical protein OJ996_11930 [Luteolibacter sp. GHJ8]|uniref:Nucleotide-diphospho-sugar transferase domain-containing protein n=1 Tax=Luteolibacter rhizosphaerae TaxID=2989719 RepID=A0ABT3G411_9BACT|nr:hypothetical protein [Luteolibacter rhizosphaerae]MCW1914289.1 hypothetical protein [Luteolibacter rhizosphaerae]
MNLAVMFAFTGSTSHYWPRQAKWAVSSLVRSTWQGEIKIWRGWEKPLFPHGRQFLSEEYFDFSAELESFSLGDTSAKEHLHCSFLYFTWLKKFLSTIPVDRYKWILLFDADVVFLRDIGHLLKSSRQLILHRYIAEGCEKIDGGFLALRSEIFHDFILIWMAELKIAVESHWDKSRSEIISEIVSKRGWTMDRFEAGEVLTTTSSDALLFDAFDAAVVHVNPSSSDLRTRISSGLFLSSILGEGWGGIWDSLEM